MTKRNFSLGLSLLAGALSLVAPQNVFAKNNEKEMSQNREEVPWIHRWAPEPRTAELGVFGGVFLPSKRLELFAPNRNEPRQGFKMLDNSIDFGFRGGYYPIRHLGIEGEAALMPTTAKDGSGQALVYGLRSHVVGQLGLWSVTPFVLAGVSALGVDSNSDVVGQDADLTFHYGFGLKAYVNRNVVLRVDVRDNVSARRGIDSGVANSWEVLGGISVVLGRQQPKREQLKEVVFEEPKDTDGDGYVDPEDDCPYRPENYNGYEDEDGCPDELPQEVENFMGVLEGIHFDFDKATIRPESEPTLHEALNVMNNYPGLRVAIIGHTDSKGNDSYNMKLSHRRAVSVKNWLVDHGVDPSRMTTRGMGETSPLESNRTEEGRATNRRIEFVPMTEVNNVRVVN